MPKHLNKHAQSCHVSGWFILNKPIGITSQRAVQIVRRAFFVNKAGKAGHAGTLDPLASGVLAIALGQATKTIPFVMNGIKHYEFTVRFGVATNTDDREGDSINTSTARPTYTDILNALPHFTGHIEQTPPQFSAIKVNGQRAYAQARQGQHVTLKPRSVFIEHLSLKRHTPPDYAEFVLHCSKGSYVRALARDLGEYLGCYGHVHTLHRTRTGCFDIAQAYALNTIKRLNPYAQSRHTPNAHLCLHPVQKGLAGIPNLPIAGIDAQKVQHGQTIAINTPMIHKEVTAVVSCCGQAIAIGCWVQGVFKPNRIIQNESISNVIAASE